MAKLKIEDIIIPSLSSGEIPKEGVYRFIPSKIRTVFGITEDNRTLKNIDNGDYDKITHISISVRELDRGIDSMQIIPKRDFERLRKFYQVKRNIEMRGKLISAVYRGKIPKEALFLGFIPMYLFTDFEE